MARFLIAPLVALALTGCAATQAPTASSPTPSALHGGAVTSADERAQAAGEAMLRMGGNATDAALATMIALTVVEPQSSGIGGGGFLVRGDAAGGVDSYDGREKAPAGATEKWFYVNGAVPGFRESQHSGLSIGVPGNIAMAALAHAQHGKLAWRDLFGPAITLARDGFAMNQRLVDSLASNPDHSGWSETARAMYFGPDGKVLPAGTVVRNEALAATFEAIAEKGPEAFYKGAIADGIAATAASHTPHPGAMTPADLAAYEAKERSALCGEYRHYRICSMGPPSSGGVAVLQMLGMLERFDLKALGPENPVAWHLFIEAQRLAYTDRELYMADSDFVSVPVAGLLDKAYLARRSALIDPARSMAVVVPGIPAGAVTAQAVGVTAPEHGTSHIAAVDGDGTMVSYTSTIESAFGSGLMSGGFYLNNELTDFSRSGLDEGKPVANRVEGGKRPRSSMSPTVIWDPSGKPFLVVGAAGGATIPVSTTRTIIGVIDFGLSAEDALKLPFLMSNGETLMLEEGTWLQAAAPEFARLGHTKTGFGAAPIKAGAILHTSAGWVAAHEPRLGISTRDSP